MSNATKKSKNAVATRSKSNSRKGEIIHTISTKAALLRAIIENPDEDTPRLAFADFLDESDEDHDRAEFIRLQCHLLGANADDPERESNMDRLGKLLIHTERWVEETFGQELKAVEFVRGFPQTCSVTANALVKHGAEWCQRTPLSAVTLGAVRGRAEPLAACPHLRHLTRLTIYDRRFGDDDLAALSTSPHLTRLEELFIGQPWARRPTQVTDLGVKSLSEAEFLHRLKHLRIIADGNLCWYGLVTLALSKKLAALETLLLMNTTIDDRGVHALADAGSVSLTKLYILGNEITDGGLLKLATSPGLPKLTHISLWRSEITPGVFRALAKSPHSSRLEGLDLSNTPMSDVNANEIGTLLDARPKLHLILSNCGLRREVWAELVRRYPGRVD